MLKVSTVSYHIGSESNAPLFDCASDDFLTEQAPLLHETHLQMFHVTYPATIDTFLENAPNLVIDWIRVVGFTVVGFRSGLFGGHSSGVMKSGVSRDRSSTVSCPMCWSTVLLKGEVLT